ncbi:hypothetical protein ACIBI9_04545 [Nonomuraea sp. NPDC050451]|uniref:hypothetical protein n=1 Tax=Nonomuraea sp. NPDC050451 TaxID=3364364 RepID=UPI003787C45F
MKLRVDGLEACDRLGDATPGGGGELELLREINDRAKRLETQLAAMKAETAMARTETIEQFAAVDVEIAGIRREINAHLAVLPGDGEDYIPTQIADEFASVRAEIAQEFNAIRSELLDVGIKLDRLLKKDYM